jgi:hypothetical protein
VRYQERREAEALRGDAERLVERLCWQNPDPAQIVETLRADPALSEPQRHANPKRGVSDGHDRDDFF